jgi:2-polyprenyl-6-methoxyphenol hydroxylase-like FAD-dependent oxidoreductase
VGTNNSPHVLIIGAGVGGLALAQGLKKLGVSFEVYESGLSDAGSMQGYRLTISDYGSYALHECLPAELFDAFVETSGELSAMSMIDEKMNEVSVVTYPADVPPERKTYSADRGALRRTLLEGLSPHIQYDKKFVRYEQGSDGRVTAFFEDGTSASGDLLVGADGVRSQVRTQLLPEAGVTKLDSLGVGGKLQMKDGMPSDKSLEEALAVVRGGNAAVIGAGGTGLFLGRHNREYVMWNFVARAELFNRGLSSQKSEDLQGDVLAAMTGYDERLRLLVAQSDPETVVSWPFHYSPNTRPWKSTNVTLLGDAIHPMPPTTGAGANTALHDARLLCREVSAVKAGKKALLEAVRVYEAAMLRFSAQVVRQSMLVYGLSTTESRLVKAVVNRSFQFMHRLFSQSRHVQAKR